MLWPMRAKTLRVRTLLRDRRGAASIEYVVLLMLIAMAGLIAWQEFHEGHEAEAESQVANVSALDW